LSKYEDINFAENKYTTRKKFSRFNQTITRGRMKRENVQGQSRLTPSDADAHSIFFRESPLRLVAPRLSYVRAKRHAHADAASSRQIHGRSSGASCRPSGIEHRDKTWLMRKLTVISLHLFTLTPEDNLGERAVPYFT